MPRNPTDFSVSVKPAAYILAAFWLLVLPLRWCLAAVVAAGIHELFHCLAVWICGGRILRVEIGPGGAVLEAAPMSRGRELFSTLAGPAGGILTVLLLRRLPRIAICAALQTAWNLLPLLPLDGGRAVQSAAHLLLPDRAADRVCNAITWICKAGIGILGIYGTFFAKLGLLPLLLAGALLLRTARRKNSLQKGTIKGTIK